MAIVQLGRRRLAAGHKISETKVVDTDILVIGGGAAAAYAAIEASKHGLRVIMVSKGKIGKSGCSVCSMSLSGAPPYTQPYDQKVFFEKQVSTLMPYLADQEKLKAEVEMVKDVVFELEQMGLYYRRNSDGSVRSLGPTTLISPKRGLTGKSIMDVMRGEIIRRGINVLEEMVATSLLTRSGIVVGATAFDYVNGKFIVIPAKSVILATGDWGRLWTHHTGTRELSADGHMIAYRIGVELTDVEMTIWTAHNVVLSDTMRISVTPQLLGPGMNPSFYNSNGELFLKEAGGLSYDAFALVIHKEIEKTGGRCFVSLKHIDQKILEELWAGYPALKKFGLDPAKDLIELHFYAHNSCGGVRTNANTETNVEGLYAAGAVTGFYSGFLNCFWAGKTSGRVASNRASKIEMPSIDWQKVEKEKERILSLVGKDVNSFHPAQLKRQIREIMTQKMGYIKNKTKMEETIYELQKVRDEMLPKMGLRTNTAAFNYDLVSALDVVNMLDAAEIITRASLIRQESRGVFRRDDYPEKDNNSWLKNIVIKLENGKMSTYTLPVQLTYFRP